MISKPELIFRGEVDRAMNGLWTMTWHEDREINPGVPDLSYVMNGLYYETGWIELKAIRYDPKALQHKFTLEPSQHTWISKHHSKIPVHLLLAVGDHSTFLVGGEHHKRLAEPISSEELRLISTAKFDRSAMRRELHDALKICTDRRRNVQRI